MKLVLAQLARALCLSGLAAPALAGVQPANIEVFEIQGAGLASTHAGQTVRIPDSVVTAVMADGFFLQTPDARADSDDALTANGIRVVTAGAPVYPAGGGSVQVGHLLAATGSVSEVNGETRLTVTVPLERIGSTSVPLPAAVEFSVVSGKPRSRPDYLYCFNGLSNFECFEGMRVSLPTGRVASGNQTSPGDDFGPVYVSPLGERSLREKGLRFGAMPVPGNILAGFWDNPEVLRMDADRLGAVANGTAIAGGAQFSATGVLAVADGDYTLWPTTLNLDAPSNTLPVAVGLPTNAVLRVASFDLTALCDSTAGNTPQPCATPEPSAAQVTTQVTRLARYMDEVLRGPEVVAVQNVENQTVLSELANALTARVAGSSYSGMLLEGTDPRGLDLAYLVDTTRVSGAAIQKLAANETDPTTGGSTPLHRKPPLLLDGTFNTPAPGAPQAFRVLNVHVVDRTGVDAGTGSARERRFAQASSIANLVQGMQIVGGQPSSVPLLVAGKLNAWNTTDGYVDVLGLIAGTYFNGENLLDVPTFNLVSPVLRDTLSLLPEGARVTATEVESFGAVQGAPDRKVGFATAYDHLLLTAPAQQIARLAALGRGNADAPLKLREIGSGAGPVASSAFDAVVMDLEPNCRAVPGTNTDNDAWCNLLDNCPTIANDQQLDTDGDLSGDECDPDIDGDGVNNPLDNCPMLVNPGQQNLDGDSFGDICDDDIDGDGVLNTNDNCPFAINPLQENYDGDSAGDACDPNADMVLSLSPPATVAPGASFTTTVTVAHAGPMTVQTLILHLTLPGQSTFQSINPGAWTCDPVAPGTAGAEITCRRASMAPGNSSISVTATAGALLTHGTQLQFSANVTPDDLNSANNTQTGTTTVVVGNTDLRLQVFGPSPTVHVGDVLVFSNTVNNLGQRGVTDLTFRVTRPAGTEFTAVSPDAGWNCSTPSPALVELVCTRSLDAGGQSQLGYNLTVLPTASGQFQVTAAISSSVSDPNMVNNSVSLSFDVDGGVAPGDSVFANGFES